MKKFLVLVLFSGFILGPEAGFAQAPTWTPIFLSASGNHVKAGVEAYFQRATCCTDEVVFIKFVNTNNYNVVLGWYNAVFTQSVEWIHDNDHLLTLVVPASSTNTGGCSGEALLMVKLSDFITDPATFKRFTTSQLTVDQTN